MAELLQHARVVVVPASVAHEGVHVGVGIEHHAGEQRRVRAREGGNDGGGRLQVAPLVMANLGRVDVVGEATPKLRRRRGARQVLAVVIGEDFVVLRPLAVGGVLLQMIVDVPLGNVAARVGPDAAVEDELHRQFVGDGEGDDAVQRVLRDGAALALVRDIEIGIERPVAAGTRGRAQVEDRHGKSDPHRARQVRAVDGRDAGSASRGNAGGHHQEGHLLVREPRRGIEQRAPSRHRGRSNEAALREHGLAPVARDDDDRERVRADGIGRELGGKVAVEREPGAGAVGIARICLRDISACDAYGGGKFARVEAHFHRGHPCAIERPAVDLHCRSDERVGRWVVDPADRRRGRRGRGRRGRAGLLRAAVLRQCIELDSGDGQRDGDDREQRTRHAFNPADAVRARARARRGSLRAGRPLVCRRRSGGGSWCRRRRSACRVPPRARRATARAPPSAAKRRSAMPRSRSCRPCRSSSIRPSRRRDPERGPAPRALRPWRRTPSGDSGHAPARASRAMTRAAERGGRRGARGQGIPRSGTRARPDGVRHRRGPSPGTRRAATAGTMARGRRWRRRARRAARAPPRPGALRLWPGRRGPP